MYFFAFPVGRIEFFFRTGKSWAVQDEGMNITNAERVLIGFVVEFSGRVSTSSTEEIVPPD